MCEIHLAVELQLQTGREPWRLAEDLPTIWCNSNKRKHAGFCTEPGIYIRMIHICMYKYSAGILMHMYKYVCIYIQLNTYTHNYKHHFSMLNPILVVLAVKQDMSKVRLHCRRVALFGDDSKVACRSTTKLAHLLEAKTVVELNNGCFGSSNIGIHSFGHSFVSKTEI